jgi:uridine kinase
MTAAILISGYLRSYDNIIKYVQTDLINHFDEYDVFIHITKNESKEDKYLNLIDEETDIKKIINKLKPKSVLIEENEHYTKSTNIDSTINQWAKLYRLNTIKTSYEILEGKKYDVVIRLRPDLHIKTNNIFNIKCKENTIYIPKDSKIDHTKLLNINDEYLCDAIAFGTSESMDKYFLIYENIYNNIKKYGYISETLLINHLRDVNLKVKKMNIDYSFILSKCNVFAICGDSGSGKSTLSEILKGLFKDSFTLECDRYHKWERGNKNWSKFTHLNPSANYIEKMKEDVFNLKIGKEIYQVDYDHKTGKFTEQQQIDPSNNLIICGLHTIYDEKINSLYDVKIFMDPQKELKYKWKIIRDVKHRGYSVEKVLESIKQRESDYEKYILPQKDNANIVVSFFSKNEIKMYDLDDEDEIGLKITLDKDINIEYINNILSNSNISYEKIEENDKTSFIFNNYTPSPLIKNYVNNFYDYVILFILNL